METYQIVLVRHGESEGNKKNLFCGWYDAELTANGKQQATKAGKVLKGVGGAFDIAYTSLLTRAQETLQCILAEIGQPNIPVVKTWRLNERHFGGLTGLEKGEAIKKYGEEQVNKWRRCFNYDVSLPPMEPDHPYYENIVKDPRYVDGPSPEEFPKFETLRAAIGRTLLFWNDTIVPQVKSGKRIIIVSHENPLRGIIEHLEQISDDEILVGNLLNAVPFVYTLDNNLKPIKSVEFLGDSETVKNALDALHGSEKDK